MKKSLIHLLVILLFTSNSAYILAADSSEDTIKTGDTCPLWVGKLIQQAKQGKVVQPVQPVAPVTPTQPKKPVVTPVQPVTQPKDMPITPVQPIKPITPVTPIQPIQQPKKGTPITPVQPIKPITPVTPVQPVKPVTPTQPKKGGAVVTPVQPVQPTKSVDKPTKPVKPVSSASAPTARLVDQLFDLINMQEQELRDENGEIDTEKLLEILLPIVGSIVSIGLTAIITKLRNSGNPIAAKIADTLEPVRNAINGANSFEDLSQGLAKEVKGAVLERLDAMLPTELKGVTGNLQKISDAVEQVGDMKAKGSMTKTEIKEALTEELGGLVEASTTDIVPDMTPEQIEARIKQEVGAKSKTISAKFKERLSKVKAIEQEKLQQLKQEYQEQLEKGQQAAAEQVKRLQDQLQKSQDAIEKLGEQVQEQIESGTALTQEQFTEEMAEQAEITEEEQELPEEGQEQLSREESEFRALEDLPFYEPEVF